LARKGLSTGTPGSPGTLECLSLATEIEELKGLSLADAHLPLNSLLSQVSQIKDEAGSVLELNGDKLIGFHNLWES
jgi:hypothetical protein